MNLKIKNSFRKVGLLAIVLCVPLLVLTSCGAPASNKYLTTVASFEKLLRYPNPDPTKQEEVDAKDQTITVHYSLLVKSNQSTHKWSYTIDNGTDPSKNQSLTTAVDSSFISIYGVLVNTIANNIAFPASVLATSIASYNRSLPEDKKDQRVVLFKDDQDKAITDDNEFYNAMANNMFIANNEKNVGFTVSDLTFKIKEINPTDDSIKEPGSNVIDLRQNNNDFKNENGDITDDSSQMSSKNVSNRLSKIYAVTDISVWFRYYVAGSENGETPSRNQIVISNPTSESDKRNQEIAKEAYHNAYKDTSAPDLTTYAYKLTLNDMVTTLLYTVSDIKKDQETSQITYKITPSLIQSLTPISWMNESEFTLANGNTQPNVLQMDSGLKSVLADKTKILTEEQYQNKNNPTTEEARKTFIGRNTEIELQSNAFITKIKETNIKDLDKIKNQIVLTTNSTNNLFNFTLEDYYAQYFKSLVSDDNTPPFVEDITKTQSTTKTN